MTFRALGACLAAGLLALVGNHGLKAVGPPSPETDGVVIIGKTNASGRRIRDCLGGAVAPKVVLTARHCDERFVWHGSNLASAWQTTTESDPTKHPTEDVMVRYLIDPIPVPISTTVDQGGLLRVGLEGWVNAYRQTQDDWITLPIKVVSMNTTKFVAEVTSGSGELCHGDSGAPFFATVDGGTRVVGTLSRASPPPKKGVDCSRSLLFVRMDGLGNWLETNKAPRRPSR